MKQKKDQPVRYEYPPSMDVVVSFMKRFDIAYTDTTLSSEPDMRFGGIRWFWNVRVFSLNVDDVRSRLEEWRHFYNKEISTYYHSQLSDFYVTLKKSKKHLPFVSCFGICGFRVSKHGVYDDSCDYECFIPFSSKGLKDLESMKQIIALGFAIAEERLQEKNISLEQAVNMGILHISGGEEILRFNIKKELASPAPSDSISDW